MVDDRPLLSISRQACCKKAHVTICIRPIASMALTMSSRLDMSTGFIPVAGSSLAK